MNSLKSIAKSQLFTNFLSLASVQGINYLLPLVTIPYLFNVLGVEKYGLNGFGNALTQYFILFTDFGFSLSAVKYISIHRDDNEKINHFLNATLLAGFLLVLISLFGLLFIVYSFEAFSNEKLFFLSYFGMVVGNSLFPTWFFQGIEKMKFITIVNVTLKTVSILPIFFLVKSPADYKIVPILYSIGYLVAGFVSLYLIYGRMNMDIFLPKKSLVWWTIKDSSLYFLSRVGYSLYTVSNPFILGLAAGNVAVGYYDVAEKIYKALNSIYSPITGAIYPYMAKNKDILFFKKVFFKIIIINFVLLVIAYILSPYIMSNVFNVNIADSITVLRILLIACVITAPSILLGFPFLAALGYANYANGSIIISSIIHVVGLSILYYTQNITICSVAWMVLVTEISVLLIRVYGATKHKLFTASFTTKNNDAIIPREKPRSIH